MEEINEQNTGNYPDKLLEIGLSDILRTLDKLAPKSESANKIILESLGFEWKMRDSNSSNVADFSANRTGKKGEEGTHLNLESLWQGKTSSGAKPLEPVKQNQPPSLEEGGDFRADWEMVVELPKTNVEEHLRLPAYISLFKENWVRGIVSILLAVPEQLTALDFKLIERLFLTASPIEKLPYLSSPTLNHGVQLLLDVSESMQPFWRDEAELINTLKRLLDPRRVSIHKFEFNLWSSRSEIIWWEGGLEFLQEKKPVLLVSDFGAAKYGNPFNVSDYKSLLVLFRQLKSKNCPLYALLPTGRENFPKDLKKFIPISFAWDRYISPQMISRLKRR